MSASDGPCPQEHLHDWAPAGYLAWHDWAREMARTHYQVRCPGCGRYKLWRVRPAAVRQVWASCRRCHRCVRVEADGTLRVHMDNGWRCAA